MNSRERVLSSIKHKEPDRIPIDLGSTPSSGISAIAYNNLKNYLSLNRLRNRVYDVVQQVTQPEEVMLQKFNVDIVDIGRMFNTEDSDWYKFTLQDGSEAEYPKWFKPVTHADGSCNAYSTDGTLIGKMPKGGTFFDQTVFPYQDEYPSDYKSLEQDMGKVIWSALAHSPWDHSSKTDFWTKLREKAQYLHEHSERALMIVCGCNLFEWGTFLRRMDNFLMDLYIEPDKVEELLDALMERHMSTLGKVCEAVGDLADIIRFGDDLGMDQGPLMSPETYRKFFKPRHKMLCDFVKNNSKMSTFLHSCGSIYKLIPDLIDAGYDIINPVQTSCKDMEPERLKKEFGADITFWGGGCDTRHIINHGTPQQVKDDVKTRLEVLAPGGGFIFNTVHNILPDVPPENIVAMFEAVEEFSN